MKPKDIKILSIHWGLSIGGVGKYASIIDDAQNHPNVHMKSYCILDKNRQIDTSTLNKLNYKTVIWRSGLLDLLWLLELKKEIKNWQPSFLMTHGFNGHFIALLIKIIFNIKLPIICSYHGQYHATTPIRKLLEKPYNSFTEWVIRNWAVNTIAVAGFCKQYLISKRVDPKRIKVIHNGIKNCKLSNTKRKKLRQEWGIREDELLIGIASRLDPVKGVSYLLDSFIKLAPRHKNIKLILIGTGTLNYELKSMVSNAGLDSRIFFTGFRTDIKECLTAFDIFVLPSLAEYHSIALLEAMRAGKAIIATDVGGNTESARDEKEALIIPSANSIALAEAIARLLEDDSLRVRLGQNARQRFLTHFTIDQTVKKTAEWFTHCACSI